MSKKTNEESQNKPDKVIEISINCSPSHNVATLAVQTNNAISKQRKQLHKENEQVKTVRVKYICLSTCGIDKKHLNRIISRQAQAIFPNAEVVVEFIVQSSK